MQLFGFVTEGGEGSSLFTVPKPGELQIPPGPWPTYNIPPVVRFRVETTFVAIKGFRFRIRVAGDGADPVERSGMVLCSPDGSSPTMQLDKQRYRTWRAWLAVALAVVVLVKVVWVVLQDLLHWV